MQKCAHEDIIYNGLCGNCGAVVDDVAWMVDTISAVLDMDRPYRTGSNNTLIEMSV